MWALMDTGARRNVVNRSTVIDLLGSAAKDAMQPCDEHLWFFRDGQYPVKHTIDLDFFTGKSRHKFEKIHFRVFDNPEGTDEDGIQDVILGLQTLWEHSMVMIELDFLHVPEADLPVVAKRAESEKQNVDSVLVLGYHGPNRYVLPPRNKQVPTRPPGSGLRAPGATGGVFPHGPSPADRMVGHRIGRFPP